MSTERKAAYRSAAWFGKTRSGRFRASQLDAPGSRRDVFDGRPVIGICNTWSELTPCNAHFRELAEHVKRGVWEAGGFPLEFPVTVAGRNEHAAHGDALPQPGQHGRGGVHPREPDRRGRAAVRLRQNHARAGDGRGELRRSGAGRFRRPDAQRQILRDATSAPERTSGGSTRK